MEELLGRPLAVKYYPRDETIGWKEPPLLQVLRNGHGSGAVYELRDSYGGNVPEDVYLFIEECCSKPFYEADYAFCLEIVMMDEFEDRFLEIKQKASQMQADLTKEQKRASMTPVQVSMDCSVQS
jgi:hypothetical protein|tara:strand:+ start:258 stop:632 length:375 start_codon:yes stop_codon:yes gene_type:complete